MAADELFGPDGTQAFSLDGPREPVSAAVLGDTLGDALGGLVTGPAFEPGDWSGDEPADERDSVHSTGNTPFPAAPDQQQLRSAVDKAMMAGPPTNPLRIGRPALAQRVRPAPTVTAAALPQLAAPLPSASRRTPAPTLPTAPSPVPSAVPYSTGSTRMPTTPSPVPSAVPYSTGSTRMPTTPSAVPSAVPYSTGSTRMPTTPSPVPSAVPYSTRPTRMPSGTPVQPLARASRSNLAGRPTLRSRHPAVSALLKLAVLIIFVVLVLMLHSFGGTLSGLFQ